MRVLAAEYGVSDTGLAKLCKRLNVPRPGRGYWAQIAAGGKPKKAPLLAAKAGTCIQDAIERHPPRAPEASREPEPPAPDIAVTERLMKPHAVVQALDGALRHEKSGRFGLLQVPGLAVTAEHKDRALRILDALLKALVERGHAVRSRREPYYDRNAFGIEVQIGEEAVGLWIGQVERRKKHVLTPEEIGRKKVGYYTAPGFDVFLDAALTIEIYQGQGAENRHSIREDAAAKLESQVGRVVVAVERAGESLRQRKNVAAERQQRWAEQQHIRAEEERKERYQKALAEDLERMVDCWCKAEHLRCFLAAIEARFSAEQRSPGFAAWLNWAKAYAETVDPLNEPEKLPKKLEPEPTKL